MIPTSASGRYEYDLGNRLIKQTDARGQVTSLKYDQLDRLLERCIGPTTGCTGAAVLAKNTYDQAPRAVLECRAADEGGKSGRQA